MLVVFDGRNEGGGFIGVFVDRFRHRLVIGASDTRPDIGALSPDISPIFPRGGAD